MKFVKLFFEKKFILVNIFLFSYIFINLLDCERGLLSFYKKKNLKEDLILERNLLSEKLMLIEKKKQIID